MVRILDTVEESMYELLANVIKSMRHFGNAQDSVVIPLRLNGKAKQFIKDRGFLVESVYFYKSGDFVKLTIRSVENG